eukprot:TRINITY_DN4416_c0_g1_i1.p1 TRINITY_DN4416_c0_g1~~TRINITY_DN4416_c0_g1_i1.p1  ORF type:complete len:1574 (+),score=568.59 TRINITY_DN4416_c0_g1_i1:88-4809(+)
MQLSGEAVHWLVANGALSRSIKAKNDKSLVRLNILDSDCVENGHSLHRLLSVMSKRLGISLGIIPELGCTEDEYCSPAIRKFNWDILSQLLRSFGFDLEEDAKDLVVAGDTEILRQTLEEIHSYFDELSAQQNGESKQVGYSYFYQPKPLPLSNAAPTSPELSLNRCSSVPSKEPPQWTDDASSDKPTSQPAGEKPSWTNRQKQLIEDLQNKRKNQKLQAEEEELAKARTKERQKKALRNKVEKELKAQRQEREEKKRHLQEHEQSPKQAADVTPTTTTPSKTKKQPRPKVKRAPIRTAIPNKIGLLICQSIITEIVTEVCSGEAKTRLADKKKLRQQHKKHLKERREEERDLAAAIPHPIPKQAEDLKKHNRANILLVRNIINDILTSIANGDAQKRLQRRKQEVKKAKLLRHREVLVQAEKLPTGVSASEQHKKRIAEEREQQKQLEIQENTKRDKERQARQALMKQQLELDRKRKADEAEALREKEAEAQRKEEKKMRLLKIKRQKEEERKKQEIGQFHQRREEDEKFNKLSDERQKERELEERKKSENREKRMKKKLAEWKAKEKARREEEEEKQRLAQLEEKKQSKKKKKEISTPVKPKTITPAAQDPEKLEALLNDVDLHSLSPVSGLPSELKGSSRGERLLTCVENQVLEHIIEARRDPSQPLELLHNRMQCFVTHNTLRISINEDSRITIKTKEGIEGCEEAIEFLNTARGQRQPIKEVSVGLSMAARLHAADLASRDGTVIDTSTGSDGSNLTDRLKRFGKYEMRCQEAVFLSSNSYTGLLPTELVISDFICCDGDRLRSNRKSLFDSNNKVVGIGHAVSRRYSKNRDRIITVDCVVVIYTNGFQSKPNSVVLKSFDQSLERVAPDYLSTDQKAQTTPECSHGDISLHIASPTPNLSDAHADTIPIGSPIFSGSADGIPDESPPDHQLDHDNGLTSQNDVIEEQIDGQIADGIVNVEGGGAVEEQPEDEEQLEDIPQQNDIIQQVDDDDGTHQREDSHQNDDSHLQADQQDDDVGAEKDTIPQHDDDAAQQDDAGDVLQQDGTQLDDNVPQQEGESKQDDDVPQIDGDAAQQDDEATEQDGDVPLQQADTTEQDGDASQQECGDVPQQEGEVLQQEDTPQQGNDASDVPQPEGAAQQDDTSQHDDDVPQQDDGVPQPDDDTPEQDGDASQQEGDAPQPDDETPDKDRDVPQQDGDTSQQEDNLPQPDDSSPEQDAVPQQEGEVPQQDGDASPQEGSVDGAAPHQEEVPQQEEDTSEPQPEVAAQQEGDVTQQDVSGDTPQQEDAVQQEGDVPNQNNDANQQVGDAEEVEGTPLRDDTQQDDDIRVEEDSNPKQDQQDTAVPQHTDQQEADDGTQQNQNDETNPQHDIPQTDDDVIQNNDTPQQQDTHQQDNNGDENVPPKDDGSENGASEPASGAIPKESEAQQNTDKANEQQHGSEPTDGVIDASDEGDKVQVTENEQLEQADENTQPADQPEQQQQQDDAVGQKASEPEQQQQQTSESNIPDVKDDGDELKQQQQDKKLEPAEQEEQTESNGNPSADDEATDVIPNKEDAPAVTPESDKPIN